MKFGAYLLKKGKIKGSELANALKSQTDDFVVFGYKAISVGILSKDQVDAVMAFQREEGGFFGDIVVRLGFLNEGEIENRLGIIDRKRYLIGEKLVFYRAISREDMEAELKRFQDWKSSRKIMRGYLDR